MTWLKSVYHDFKSSKEKITVKCLEVSCLWLHGCYWNRKIQISTFFWHRGNIL